jgi:hypothetical protein
MAAQTRECRNNSHAQSGGASPVTRHAWARMSARRIHLGAVRAALLYGRVAHVRGARIYAVGRKEVARYRRAGIALDDYEGVQVVCGQDGAILTAYRNRDFRGLRPRR